MSDIYQIEVQDIDGKKIKLEQFKNKVLLIVNVASKCGFTPQYEELEAIYQQYKEQGLEVLAFPCNQFGGQEPGSEAEIKQFCELNYQTKFPLFAKIEVNGDNTHPLYQLLKKEAKGLLGTEAVKWNFTKFLVNKNGQIVDRYAPQDKPSKIIKDNLELFA
jgi:glutathione peroxidase